MQPLLNLVSELTGWVYELCERRELKSAHLTKINRFLGALIECDQDHPAAPEKLMKAWGNMGVYLRLQVTAIVSQIPGCRQQLEAVVGCLPALEDNASVPRIRPEPMF